MSEQTLVSTRPDIAGMSRLHVRLNESPTPNELEQARVKIFSRLAEVSRGIVLDLHEITSTTVDALVMLHSSKTFAASEGKRLILYNVSPELTRLLHEHDEIFQFDVYGFAKKNTKATTKPKPRTPRLSPLAKQRIRNIGLPVLILFPIVGAIQWYVIFSAPVDSVGLTTEKSFEAGQEKFVVEGSVERLLDGSRDSVADATVVVWVTERGVDGVRKAWLTQTAENGRFKLPLPLDSPMASIGVRVAITPQPGAAIDGNGFSRAGPFQETYVSDQVIEKYQPLTVHAVF